MLIREIVTEGYQADLLTAVQDLLTSYMADDAKDIPTEDFQSQLAKHGFVTTTDELIKAINFILIISCFYLNSLNRPL